MPIVSIQTSNPIKHREIDDILALYGCKSLPFSIDGQSHGSAEVDAIIREETSLVTLVGGRLQNNSLLTVFYPKTGKTETWQDSVIGTLAEKNMQNVRGETVVYNWDDQFTPFGTGIDLHQLKSKGMKVSARQKTCGAWLRHWLHYEQPVTWNHMAPTEDMAEWLSQQSLLQHPAMASIRQQISRVADSGAWFKLATNRRTRHYWWPGMNAGIPMTPKKDYIHELTFLMHDIFHWAIPDLVPSGFTKMDFRIYMATRMISEAVTMVMADMVFVDALAKAGVDYDLSARKIHPIYDPAHPPVEWCRAMVQFAVLGDASRLENLCSNKEALTAFRKKYEVFFAEDIRWTGHNALHMFQHLPTSWMQVHKTFMERCDLGFHTTQDYHEAWSDDDNVLVDNLFSLVWKRHMEAKVVEITGSSPAIKQAQRWWCGQLALTCKMDDLPLSGLVRNNIIQVCTVEPSLDKINSLMPIWNNYVDMLESLSRIATNDSDVFRKYYPIVPPMYVSYDKQPVTTNIAEAWEAASNSFEGDFRC